MRRPDAGMRILAGEARGGRHRKTPRRRKIGLGMRLGVGDVVARDHGLEHLEQARRAQVPQGMRGSRGGGDRRRNAARPELADEGPALYGARAAVAAIDVLGHAAERIEVGNSPAPANASAELQIVHEKLDRNLVKLQPPLGPTAPCLM